MKSRFSLIILFLIFLNSTEYSISKDHEKNVFGIIPLNINYQYNQRLASLNCKTIKRHVEIMKKYGIKSDYFFTWLAGKQVYETCPEIFHEIKEAGFGIQHHGANRRPKPMPIDRCKGEDWYNDVQAILEYETHDLDPNIGKIIYDKTGGMKGLKKITSSEILSTGRFFNAPILYSAKQFGMKMCVGLEGNTGAPSNQAWFMGMLNRPENMKGISFRAIVDWALNGVENPLTRQERTLNNIDRSGFNLFPVLMHDNDFLQGGDLEKIEKVWKAYEDVVKWASQNFIIINMKEIYNMAIDDKERYFIKEQIAKAVEMILKQSVNSLPLYIDLQTDFMSLSDLFQVLTLSLKEYSDRKSLPESVKTRDIIGPTQYFRKNKDAEEKNLAFKSIVSSAKHIADKDFSSIPSRIEVENYELNSSEFLWVIADAFKKIYKEEGEGEGIKIRELDLIQDEVQKNNKADTLTKLQFWTYKPVRWKDIQ